MDRLNIYITSFFLFLFVFTLSCSRSTCVHQTFYSIYQNRFQEEKFDENFVRGDSAIKKKIFSLLCISHQIKKMLIVEYGDETHSFYSQGLLFTYDDCKTYYYRIKNDKIVAGEGKNNFHYLNKILLRAKNDFLSLKKKIDSNKRNVFDSPIINILLYDSSLNPKFDRFSFPIIIADSVLLSEN